jgi:hypothetical protein
VPHDGGKNLIYCLAEKGENEIKLGGINGRNKRAEEKEQERNNSPQDLNGRFYWHSDESERKGLHRIQLARDM